ncbi:MAG TPA: ABC transporter permease, partial [Roseimicrobium sp.]|nr:ABC transporter permease [Roseimicrobium sp.]
MSRLPFELMLALRYLRPKRTFVSVITLISIIGVTLGVAVLIIVISVMSGFDRQLREKILGFNSHIKVFQRDIPMQDFNIVRAALTNASPHVKAVAPFVMGQVMIKTQPEFGNPQISAPWMRGIDPELEGSVSSLPKNIIRGKFDVSGNGVLVGSELARLLTLDVGDRIVIYSPQALERLEKARGKDSATLPLPDEYVVRGIFDVGYFEYNATVILTSLGNAQDLYEL